VVALHANALVCFVNEAELPRDQLNDADDTWFTRSTRPGKWWGPNSLGRIILGLSRLL
jgi:hypothetical protein